MRFKSKYIGFFLYLTGGLLIIISILFRNQLESNKSYLLILEVIVFILIIVYEIKNRK